MLVIDASVALKWLIEEDGSEEAERLLAEEALAAPDLLWVECANVLRTKARCGQIRWEDAEAALAALEATPVRVIPSRGFVAHALMLARALDQTAYDCLYLAAALHEGTTLVSADQKFVAAAHAYPPTALAVSSLGAKGAL